MQSLDRIEARSYHSDAQGLSARWIGTEFRFRESATGLCLPTVADQAAMISDRDTEAGIVRHGGLVVSKFYGMAAMKQKQSGQSTQRLLQS
jgi:hypothetical protein